MTSTTAPPMRISALWCSRKASPTVDTAAAAMRKTTVKPSTKSTAPSTRRPRERRSSETSDRPVT